MASLGRLIVAQQRMGTRDEAADRGEAEDSGADQHGRIDQALVVCKRGADPAMGLAFAELVGSPDGRALMRRYGFVLPGEPTAP